MKLISGMFKAYISTYLIEQLIVATVFLMVLGIVAVVSYSIG